MTKKQRIGLALTTVGGCCLATLALFAGLQFGSVINARREQPPKMVFFDGEGIPHQVNQITVTRQPPQRITATLLLDKEQGTGILRYSETAVVDESKDTEYHTVWVLGESVR